MFSFLKSNQWKKKFLSTKDEGLLVVYDASLNSDEKMKVQDKIVLYDNRRADAISRCDSTTKFIQNNGIASLRLISYCVLEGFEKAHPYTIQLAINGDKVKHLSSAKNSAKNARKSFRSFFKKDGKSQSNSNGSLRKGPLKRSASLSSSMKEGTSYVLISLQNQEDLDRLEKILKLDVDRLEDRTVEDDLLNGNDADTDVLKLGAVEIE